MTAQVKRRVYPPEGMVGLGGGPSNLEENAKASELLNNQRGYSSDNGYHLRFWVEEPINGPGKEPSIIAVKHSDLSYTLRTHNNAVDINAYTKKRFDAVWYMTPEKTDYDDDNFLLLPRGAPIVDISTRLHPTEAVKRVIWPDDIQTLRFNISMFNRVFALPPSLDCLIVHETREEDLSTSLCTRDDMFPKLMGFFIIDINGTLDIPSSESAKNVSSVLIWKCKAVKTLPDGLLALSYGPTARVSMPSQTIPMLPDSLEYLELPKDFCGEVDLKMMPQGIHMIDIGCGWLSNADDPKTRPRFRILHMTCEYGTADDAVSSCPWYIDSLVAHIRELRPHSAERLSIDKRKNTDYKSLKKVGDDWVYESDPSQAPRRMTSIGTFVAEVNCPRASRVKIPFIPPNVHSLQITKRQDPLVQVFTETTYLPNLRRLWATDKEIFQALARGIRHATRLASARVRVDMESISGPSISAMRELLACTTCSHVAVDRFDADGEGSDMRIETLDVLSSFQEDTKALAFPPTLKELRFSPWLYGTVEVPAGVVLSKAEWVAPTFFSEANCTGVLRGAPTPYVVS